MSALSEEDRRQSLGLLILRARRGRRYGVSKSKRNLASTFIGRSHIIEGPFPWSAYGQGPNEHAENKRLMVTKMVTNNR
jgi:hypothetical protein